MGFRADIYPDRRLIVGGFWGRYDAARFIEAMGRLGADPDFDPAYNVVYVFFDDFDPSAIDLEDARRMVETAAATLRRDTGAAEVRIAGLGASKTVEIFMKLFKMLTEARPDYGAALKVCDSVADAAAWTDRDLEGIALIDRWLDRWPPGYSDSK